MEVKSRVVPHLSGERGRVSCHSSGSLEEGGSHFLAEAIEDTEDFIQFEGLYCLFIAFRFTYLIGILNSLGLLDFLIQV